MKMIISHAWFSGGVKEYDTDSGKIIGSSDKEWGSTGFGSIWRQNGKDFAFYRDNESLLLQHKTNKWRVSPEYSVSLRGIYFLRNFRIKHHGKVVFSIWYKPKDLFIFLSDPTYDAIDAESDDFFLYLKRMWMSWGNRPYSEFLNEFGADNV